MRVPPDPDFGQMHDGDVTAVAETSPSVTPRTTPNAVRTVGRAVGSPTLASCAFAVVKRLIATSQRAVKFVSSPCLRIFLVRWIAPVKKIASKSFLLEERLVQAIPGAPFSR
jgi:hypothetical protein